MPETRDFETDQMLTLLTEALRSGPGSPQWHQAVRMLRSQPPGSQSEEYQLLCDARERLESGKTYRSIRAGSGFTRKLMLSVDRHDGGQRRWITPAGLVLLLSAGVMVAVLVGIAWIVMHGGIPGKHNATEVEQLGQTHFATAVIPTARFEGPQPATMPAGWRTFGPLPIIVRNGLRPIPLAAPATMPATNTAENYLSGGIVSAQPVAADVPLDVEFSLRVSRGGDDLWAQAFVLDEPIDSAGAETRGVVCQIKQDEASVFLGGRAEPKSQKLPLNQEFPLKMLLSKNQLIVECNGQRLYAGPQPLDPASPRYIGVRFVRQSNGKEGKPDHFESWIVLLSAGVQKP